MKSICKNIAFSPDGTCLMGEKCICKANKLWLSAELPASPSTVEPILREAFVCGATLCSNPNDRRNPSDIFDEWTANRTPTIPTIEMWDREKARTAAKEAYKSFAGLPSEFDQWFDETYPVPTVEPAVETENKPTLTDQAFAIGSFGNGIPANTCPSPPSIQQEAVPSAVGQQECKLKAQLELVSGYISKIDLNGWGIEDVRDSLSKDYEYLQEEFGLLQTSRILKSDQPSSSPTSMPVEEAEIPQNIQAFINDQVRQIMDDEDMFNFPADGLVKMAIIMYNKLQVDGAAALDIWKEWAEKGPAQIKSLQSQLSDKERLLKETREQSAENSHTAISAMVKADNYRRIIERVIVTLKDPEKVMLQNVLDLYSPSKDNTNV